MAILISENLRGTLNEGKKIRNQAKDHADVGAGNIYGWGFFDNMDYLDYVGGMIKKGRCWVKYSKANDPSTTPQEMHHYMKCELTQNWTGVISDGYVYIQVNAGLTDGIGSQLVDGNDYFKIMYATSKPADSVHILNLYKVIGGVITEDYREFRTGKYKKIIANSIETSSLTTSTLVTNTITTGTINATNGNITNLLSTNAIITNLSVTGTTSGLSSNGAGRNIYYAGTMPAMNTIGVDVPSTFHINIPFMFNTISGKINMSSKTSPSNTFDGTYIYDRATGLFTVGSTSGSFSSGIQFCSHSPSDYQQASSISSQCDDSLYRRTYSVTANNITATGFDIILHRVLNVISTPTPIGGVENLYMTIEAH